MTSNTMRAPIAALVLSIQFAGVLSIQPAAAEPSVTAGKPLAELHASGFEIDTRNGPPRFRAQVPPSAPDMDPDDRWSARYYQNGVLPFPGAVAVMGTDVYVGSGVIAGDLRIDGVAKWDGSNWSALGDGPPCKAGINALLVMGADLYAGGNFREVDGTPFRCIAKWDGESWSVLGAGLDGDVNALTGIDGQLYAGGDFVTAGGVAVHNVAKWDGENWSALAGGLQAEVRAMAGIGPDLYAVSGGVRKWDGTQWSSLGDEPAAMTLAVIGTDLYFGGTQDGLSNVARWNGQDWVTLGNGLSFEPEHAVTSLAAVGTTLYAADNIFLWQTGGYSTRLWSWNGTNWTVVEDDFHNGVTALLGDGSDLLAVGMFDAIGNVAAGRAARFDGTTWTAIGNHGGLAPTDVVWATLVYDDELYVGGDFKVIGDVVADSLARWNGRTWKRVAGGVDGNVRALATDGDALYVGGGFKSAGAVAANNIARLDGTTWSPLGDGVNGTVLAIEIMDGDVYVGGDFTKAGDLSARSIAKWDGTNWSSLGEGLCGTVLAMAVGPDGLYVGGDLYEDANCAPISGVGRWDGTSWSAVGEGGSGGVYALAAAGSDIYAGGNFESMGGTEGVDRLARWDGTTWTGFGTAPADIDAIAAAGPDLYVCGFDSVAKWDGSQWSGLGSGLAGAAKSLTAIRGDLYIGGYLTSAGNKPSSFLARYRFAEPFEICGDVNGDEVLSASDALGALRAAVGSSSQCELIVCDYNGDGNVNSSDALAILRAAVGLSSSFAGKCSGSA